MNWKSHLLTFVLLFLVVVLFAQTCKPRRPAVTVAPPDARFVTLTLEGRPERIPTLRALGADASELRAQAEKLALRLAQRLGAAAGVIGTWLASPSAASSTRSFSLA